MTEYIASIYPIAVKADRPLYMGKFAIPAVGKGEKPFILEIKDHYQIETQPWFKGTRNGRQLQERKTITGEEIARDILAEWTVNHPDATPDCHPGIWIVRSRVPLFEEKNGQQVPLTDADGRQAMRAATKEEYDRMFAEDLAQIQEIQANWGEKAFMKANIMADEPKKVAWIPDYCRKLAVHYGHSPSWLKRQSDADTKVCPVCTKVIAAKALKCPNCQEVVDPKAYAQHKQAVSSANKVA